MLTGRGSRRIARLPIRRGCRLVVPPEGFLVSGQGALPDGEAARACSWGAPVGLTAREQSMTGQRL